jgi:small subunit ribosomal protein S17
LTTGRRKRQLGTVLSDKNDKTIIVGVSWLQRDRIYKKNRRRLTKFVTDDPGNEASMGDRVVIEETRPMSRTKRWRLVEIVQKVDVAEVQPQEIDPMPGESFDSSGADAVAAGESR